MNQLISTLFQKLLRLFVVTKNYQVNRMSFDHSGTDFFP